MTARYYIMGMSRRENKLVVYPKEFNSYKSMKQYINKYSDLIEAVFWNYDTYAFVNGSISRCWSEVGGIG